VGSDDEINFDRSFNSMQLKTLRASRLFVCNAFFSALVVRQCLRVSKRIRLPTAAGIVSSIDGDEGHDDVVSNFCCSPRYFCVVRTVRAMPAAWSVDGFALLSHQVSSISQKNRL
jgi:hypothetical protein